LDGGGTASYARRRRAPWREDDITTHRLSRLEQRERTRQLLLEAAEAVFVRNGYHATSVDQIAEEAGFSKGAVYSNFENKDELFLAVVERRHDSRALAIEQDVPTDKPIVDQAMDAGTRFFDVIVRDPDWSLLMMEYAAHAARHDDLRDRLRHRNVSMRERMAEFITHHLALLGLTCPVPINQLTAVLFALGEGFIIEKLTDPDGVSDDTFGTALALLFAGLVASQPPRTDGASPADAPAVTR
jgi:AcrR family transcriptional regulator